MSEDLLGHLRHLRRNGQLAQAQALLDRSLAAQPHDARLAHLAWLHRPFWWAPLQGRQVQLRRRGPDDAALLRRCWSDAGFMQRFNQQARPLPESDVELRALLQREHWALPDESQALHWTVCAGGEPVGLVSAVEWSWPHRRAEFLMGLVPGAQLGPWAAAQAAQLVFDFLARQAGLQRLSATFYAHNSAALQLALRMGFEHEGVLRGHLRSADGRRHDLVLTGLLLDETFFRRQGRLRRRLLGQGAGDD